jgi:cytochrome c oxidase subunit 2
VSTFVVSAKTFFKMYNPPDNAKEVFVVGKQWLWIFHDPSAPNGNADHLNELTVILNQPVKLTMISEDVIHSFYVPAFRMKQDVLPDRYTTAWFTPTQLGDFEVLCTQYCGLRHSQMRAVIHVVAQAPVVASAPSASGSGNHSVQSPGQKLMQEKGCLSCHAQNGNEPSIGPSLNHLFGTRVALADGRTVLIDEDYLRRALFDPNGEVVKGYSPIMPSFQGSLSEIEGTAIVNAIKNNEVETLITAKDGAKK